MDENFTLVIIIRIVSENVISQQLKQQQQQQKQLKSLFCMKMGYHR